MNTDCNGAASNEVEDDAASPVEVVEERAAHETFRISLDGVGMKECLEEFTRIHDLPDQAFEDIWQALSPRSRASVFASSRATRDAALRCTDTLRMRCALDCAGCLRHAGLLHACASRSGSDLRLSLTASKTADGGKELAGLLQLSACMHLVQSEPWSAVTQLALAGFLTGPPSPSLSSAMRHLPSAFPNLHSLHVTVLDAAALRPLAAALLACPTLHHLTLHASHPRPPHWQSYARFSDAELELSRDLPHALSRISQLRSLSLAVNVPPQDLAVLSCLTDLTTLSVTGGEEWAPCTRFRVGVEQGEDYYEQQVFPLLAAMPQLCELEAGVGSTPYTCFSQPLYSALSSPGGALRVLSLPKLQLNTDLLGAVLEGAPQLEDLTVCACVPEVSCADAPCRWRRLRLQQREHLDVRSLAFLPLHSLTQPLEVVSPGLCVSGGTMHPGGDTQAGEVAGEDARLWAGAAIDNLSRLTAGLDWVWAEPGGRPGRSFWLSGAHTGCLWSVLGAAVEAMGRVGSGARHAQDGTTQRMDALSLRAVDEGTVPALGQLLGDRLTRLRVKGCPLPPSFWDQLLACLPHLDTLILSEVQLSTSDGQLEAFARFVATAPRGLTVVVHGRVLTRRDVTALRARLATLGASHVLPPAHAPAAMGASASTGALGRHSGRYSGQYSGQEAVHRTSQSATSISASYAQQQEEQEQWHEQQEQDGQQAAGMHRPQADMQPPPGISCTPPGSTQPSATQLLLSCEHPKGSLPWEDSDDDNLEWEDGGSGSEICGSEGVSTSEEEQCGLAGEVGCSDDGFLWPPPPALMAFGAPMNE